MFALSAACSAMLLCLCEWDGWMDGEGSGACSAPRLRCAVLCLCLCCCDGTGVRREGMVGVVVVVAARISCGSGSLWAVVPWWGPVRSGGAAAAPRSSCALPNAER